MSTFRAFLLAAVALCLVASACKPSPISRRPAARTGHSEPCRGPPRVRARATPQLQRAMRDISTDACVWLESAAALAFEARGMEPECASAQQFRGTGCVRAAACDGARLPVLARD